MGLLEYGLPMLSWWYSDVHTAYSLRALFHSTANFSNIIKGCLFMGLCFYSVISIPTTLFFIHLIAAYWNYYDIGINASANSLSLIFFVTPIMLVLFTISGYIMSNLAQRVRMKKRASVGMGILGVIITFIIGFIVISGEFSDYPRPIPHNFLEFLRYYLGLAQKKDYGI
ncbi:MAG: hypothetical protein RMX65_012270 [Nostoc sp. DedQUE01]|nr:hypothetical protein [Nostoc sp. DedQUE01]